MRADDTPLKHLEEAINRVCSDYMRSDKKTNILLAENLQECAQRIMNGMTSDELDEHLTQLEQLVRNSEGDEDLTKASQNHASHLKTARRAGSRVGTSINTTNKTSAREKMVLLLQATTHFHKKVPALSWAGYLTRGDTFRKSIETKIWKSLGLRAEVQENSVYSQQPGSPGYHEHMRVQWRKCANNLLQTWESANAMLNKLQLNFTPREKNRSTTDYGLRQQLIAAVYEYRQSGHTSNTALCQELETAAQGNSAEKTLIGLLEKIIDVYERLPKPTGLLGGLFVHSILQEELETLFCNIGVIRPINAPSSHEGRKNAWVDSARMAVTHLEHRKASLGASAAAAAGAPGAGANTGTW